VGGIMFAKGCFDDQPQLTSLPDPPESWKPVGRKMVCSEALGLDMLRQAQLRAVRE
jgi:hypothetical protein